MVNRGSTRTVPDHRPPTCVLGVSISSYVLAGMHSGLAVCASQWGMHYLTRRSTGPSLLLHGLELRCGVLFCLSAQRHHLFQQKHTDRQDQQARECPDTDWI